MAMTARIDKDAKRIGIRPEAAEAWQKKFHGQTAVAIVSFFVCPAGALAMASYWVYGTRAGAYMYAFRGPLLAEIVLFSLYTISIFRIGSTFQHAAQRKGLVLCASAAAFAVHVLAFVCPRDSVPFAGTVHCTVVVALHTLTLLIASLLHPYSASEPGRSPASLMFLAFLSIVRIITVLTDLAILRVFSELVRCPVFLPLTACVPLTFPNLRYDHVSTMYHARIRM